MQQDRQLDAKERVILGTYTYDPRFLSTLNKPTTKRG